MAMLLTEALLGEHGVFKALFSWVQGSLAHGDSEESWVALASLLLETLGGHARLEDELLFKALEPHLGTEGGPLYVMRLEHDEIETALGRAASAGKAAPSEVMGALGVAAEHFVKEERVLFPMARELLGEETLRRLGAEWSARRDVFTA